MQSTATKANEDNEQKKQDTYQGLKLHTFHVMQHTSPENKDLKELSCIRVRQISPDFIIFDRFTGEGLDNRIALPIEEIQGFVSIPTRDLEAKQPRRVLQSKAGRHQEPLDDYFERFVGPFIVSQGLKEFWKANQPSEAQHSP